MLFYSVWNKKLLIVVLTFLFAYFLQTVILCNGNSVTLIDFCMFIDKLLFHNLMVTEAVLIIDVTFADNGAVHIF